MNSTRIFHDANENYKRGQNNHRVRITKRMCHGEKDRRGACENE